MKKPQLLLVATSLALIASILVCSSCGSSNPEEDGYAAMQDGDHGKAVTLLSKAFDAAEPGSAKAHELAVARLQSLAHEDAQACKVAFLGLKIQGIEATLRDYEDVATELMGVKAFEEAAHVVAAGIIAFEESKRLPEFLSKLKSLAASGETPGLASTLAGLGYSGE